MLVTASVYQYHTSQMLNLRNEDYGQALASMAARQAVDATLNHDLVSLQVILQDIADNPNVEAATIHDVENRLLVQAGNSPSLSSAELRRNYSAAITLHDSIAGYVTVCLDLSPQDDTHNLWLALVCAATILVSIGALALYREQLKTPFPNPDPVAPNHKASAQHPDIKSTANPEAGHCAILTLASPNLKQLRQQLNGHMQKQLLQQIEQQINSVITLYNGRFHSVEPHRIQLAFHSHSDLTESAFFAVCSGLLILSLQAGNNRTVQVRFSAAVTPAVSGESDLYQRLAAAESREQCLQQLQLCNPGTVLVAAELLDSGDLEQRLSFHPREQHSTFAKVRDICEPYLNLLEKQRRQLRDI